MSAAVADPVPFEARGAAGVLRGEAAGEGPVIVTLHGLTANRRYVLHGSRHLQRRGFRVVSYDARGHGESDPAPPDAGYDYGELAADLGALLDAQAPGRRVVLACHSMGSHTAVRFALEHGDRLAGLVLGGPAHMGEPPTAEQLAYWDSLADGLEQGGVEGFVRAYDVDLNPDWREVILRLARERLSLHRHPAAIVRALREVPRSLPFEGIEQLERIDVPALVVGSHDEADPGHPYAVARAWAERLPRARFAIEDPGASPLTWSGGRLSREIEAFCGEPEVAARLAA
ncbi:MAG TPA: alpha/beta hydrolase [Solirubrobacterales bacterium]